MRKFYLFMALFVMASTINAQETTFPLDSLTKKATYTAIVKADGSKELLFDKVMEWFALSFRDSKDIIQIKDKEAGKLMATFNAFSIDGMPVIANLIILVKDGRYKYTISDIVFNGNQNFRSWGIEENPSPFKVNMAKISIKKIKKGTKLNLESLIESLINKMGKPLLSTDF